MSRITLKQLFLELAQPDDDGFSRAVPITEFVGKYDRLRLGNGGSWCRDDPRLSDANLVELDDFQPLSKAVNLAKRQHCKECRETGNRFDARRLGYSISQFKGNGRYNGTCIGCYWHDPLRFNAEASAGYGTG